MNDLASFTATIRGRVQGVFFRAFVAEKASELGLTGYVHNLHGGGVEVLAEGERRQLEKLIDYLKAGPPDAKVKKVVTHWLEYTGSYSDFRVRY